MGPLLLGSRVYAIFFCDLPHGLVSRFVLNRLSKSMLIHREGEIQIAVETRLP